MTTARARLAAVRPGPDPGPRARIAPPPVAAPAALAAGGLAAALHLAGALKSAPPLAALPFDLTLAAAGLLLPALALLAASRRWVLAPVLGVPLAACGGLWLWLALSGLWSPAPAVAAGRLPEVVLLGPAMLAAGLAVGADATARRAFCAASLAIGVFVALAVAHGIAGGTVVLGGAVGADPERARVQYQIAGLAVAGAAGLAAVRAAEARGPLAALAWLGLVAALAAAALLPGGRAALAGLALSVALAPALRLGIAGRPLAALAWAALAAAAGLGALALLLADPGRAEGLRTLERLTAGDAADTSVRARLWGEALARGGAALPFGLGPGGFQVAAGFGDRRALHAHSHPVEAFAEGGLPGLVLWLGAFGGGAAVAGWAAMGGTVAGGAATGGGAARRARRDRAARVARVAAVALPVALSVLVSTDLGNRMAWFALGLLLSLGAEARDA